MMSSAITWMLLAGLTQANPESIALETRVEAATAGAVSADVSEFLHERIREAWSLEPRARDDAQFKVTLTWLVRDEVWICVHEGDRTWVDRSVPVEDSGAARAMVWLLVRSTIERVLLHAAPPEPQDLETPPIPRTPPIPPAAPTGPPDTTLAQLADDGAQPSDALFEDAPPTGDTTGVEVEALADGPAEDWLAAASEPETPEPVAPEVPAAPETPTATVAAAAPPPPPPVPVASSPETPLRPRPVAATGLRRLWSAPFTMRPGDSVSASLVLRGFADPSSGVGWGPAAQARLNLAERLVLGAEFGYRSERKSDELSVDHVPLTIFAGYQLASGLPLEIGVTTSLDARFVTIERTVAGNPSARTGLTAGLSVGGYARAHYTLWERERSELRLVGEFGTTFALLRSAYVVDDQTEKDGIVHFSSGLGVEWRWR